MHDGKVSVILPVYNASRSLEKCLNSILSQTYESWELLAIDDGSNDDSLSILKNVKQRDNRIRVISQENKGVSAARNKGLSLAVGQYVTFIDSDDEYTAEYLSTLVDAIEASQADTVICGFLCPEAGRCVSVKPALYCSKEDFLSEFEMLFQMRYISSPWNCIYKRRVLRYKFLENMTIGEDLIFNLQNLNECGTIQVISDCLYVYHTDVKGSLTRTYTDGMMEACRIMKKQIEEFAGKEWCDCHQSFLVNKAWDDYIGCLFRLSISDRLTYRDKAKIFYDWSQDELAEYIKGNLSKIKHHRIMFLSKRYIWWYFLICGWNFVDRFFAKMRKTGINKI